MIETLIGGGLVFVGVVIGMFATIHVMNRAMSFNNVDNSSVTNVAPAAEHISYTNYVAENQVGANQVGVATKLRESLTLLAKHDKDVPSEVADEIEDLVTDSINLLEKKA